MMRYKVKGRKGKNGQRGTAAVEMAIVLVLLLMVTLGALQYGWLFVNLQKITNAARQGARVACVSGAVPAEGEAIIDTLVGSIPSVSRAVTENAGVVTAVVTVNTDAIGLFDWDRLPVPDQLRAEVKMAKEQ